MVKTQPDQHVDAARVAGLSFEAKRLGFIIAQGLARKHPNMSAVEVARLIQDDLDGKAAAGVVGLTEAALVHKWLQPTQRNVDGVTKACLAAGARMTSSHDEAVVLFTFQDGSRIVVTCGEWDVLPARRARRARRKGGTA